VAVGQSHSLIGTHSFASGFNHSVALGSNYSLVGGYQNSITGSHNLVFGRSNSFSGSYSFVCSRSALSEGGDHNAILPGYFCRNWEDGSYNLIQGYYCEIGQDGLGSAQSYSWAVGYRSKTRSSGSFTWADSTAADFVNAINNSFQVRASGGLYFAGDTMPHETSTYDLGAADYAWHRIYAVIPDSTDVAGKRHLVLDGTTIKKMSTAGATGSFYDGSGNEISVVNGIIVGTLPY